MKEKILNALKTNYANLGLGEKAFDGVASFLEKTITDENDIVTRVKGDDVAALLKGIQGETDSLRSARTKAEKDLDAYKKAHPSAPEGEKEPGEQKDDKSDAVARLLEEIGELKKRADDRDKRERREAVVAGLRSALKSAHCDSDPILNLVLSGVEVGDNDTVESMTDRYKSAYQERYKEFYGAGAVPPLGGNGEPEPYKKGKFASVVEGLDAEGAYQK